MMAFYRSLKLYALLALMVLVSCRSDSGLNTDVRALFDEVIEIHDEVMPKMGDLHYLGKELDKIAKKQSDDSALQLQIGAAKGALLQADEHMMDWMAQLKKPKAEDDPQEALRYLEGEKNKIRQIQTETNTAIRSAEALIEAHK